MPLADQLDRDLEQVLRSRAVNVVEPRDQMVQLNAVEAGAGFSKPATNVLLHRQLDLSCASSWTTISGTWAAIAFAAGCSPAHNRTGGGS